MNQFDQLNEEKQIEVLINEYQKLKQHQIEVIQDQIYHQKKNMNKLNQQLQRKLLDLIRQLPSDEHLIQEGEKRRWIHFNYNEQQIRIDIHQDLFTYAIFNNNKIYDQICIENMESKINSFELHYPEQEIFNLIQNYNSQFFQSFQQGKNQNNNSIDYNIQEVLFQQEILQEGEQEELYYQIAIKFGETIQFQFESQMKNIFKTWIDKFKYEIPHINKQLDQIKINNIAQSLSQFKFENSKQIQILSIDNNKNFKNNHIYQISDEDTHIFVVIKDLPTKVQQVSQIILSSQSLKSDKFKQSSIIFINPYSDSKITKEWMHYAEQNNYKIQKIRIIKNDLTPNSLYILTQYIIKNIMPDKDNFYNFYQGSEIQEALDYFENQFQNAQNIQNDILNYVKNICPNLQTYQDFFNIEFVNEIKKKIKIDSWPILEENQLDKLFEHNSVGAVIINKKKKNKLLGIVIKFEKELITLTKDKINNYSFHFTNIEKTDTEVLAFYCELIFQKQEKNIGQTLKQLLERNNQVLECLLKLVSIQMK